MQPEDYADTFRRRALALVLESKLTPAQAAKALNCPARDVRQLVAEHLDQDESPTFAKHEFVSVLVEDEPVPEPASGKTIPLDILTSTGLTLRLQLGSLHDVVELLHSQEADRC